MNRTKAERSADAILKAAEALESEREATAALAATDRNAQQGILAFVIASPAVATYSARNLHFIYRQFTSRGVTPVGLDTWAGWVQRGRIVEHGQRAAKVFVRKEIRGRECFRPVGSVFDISQTRQLAPLEWADMLDAKRLERVELPDPITLGAACLDAFSEAMRAQARERFGIDITGCAAELLATVTALANRDAAAKAARTAAALRPNAAADVDLF